MSKLIVARVPEYAGPEKTLTDHGRKTFRTLSEEIRTHVGGSAAVIMSSDAARALASAAILGEILGVKVESYRELFSDELNPPNLEGIFEIVKSRKETTGVIVLVTHYDIAELFPKYYAYRLGHAINSICIEKSSALVLNCLNYELIHIHES